jgi:hypothetical protein
VLFSFAQRSRLNRGGDVRGQNLRAPWASESHLGLPDWLYCIQSGTGAGALLSIMYGPPSDCKGEVVGRRDSLRKCIRPLVGVVIFSGPR